MNNEELKNKIVETIKKTIKYACASKVYMNEAGYGIIADALIAAGYGDVKEAEHRAARAEKALKHAVNVYIATRKLPQRKSGGINTF